RQIFTFTYLPRLAVHMPRPCTIQSWRRRLRPLSPWFLPRRGQCSAAPTWKRTHPGTSPPSPRVIPMRATPRSTESPRPVAPRTLCAGGILGWIIADEYRGGTYTPVGFRLLGLLERRFEPIDTIVLLRHHDRSASPMWEHRARRFNFFLRGFKFLFILRKQVGESR